MNRSLKNIRLFDNFQEEVTNEGVFYNPPEKNYIKGLYEQTTTQSTTGQTVNQMLQGKEFPDLTKQEQGDTVFYSSLDGQKRKWYISFRPSNNWIQTSISSVNPQYFNLVETLFNSLSSFKDIGPSSGLNKDTDMVFGVKQTPVNKDEIIKIFDTLVATYKKNKS